MKVKLRLFFRIFPWVLLGIISIYLAFAGGWRDITEGRRERLAAETFLPYHFPGGEEFTGATIYLLKGKPEQATQERFPGDFTVYGSMELTGDDLAAFSEAWFGQTVSDYYSSGFCHTPPYGFRLYRGSKVIREVSICWECYNFQFNAGWPLGITKRGFNPDKPQAKKLLEFCDRHLPYFRPPKEALNSNDIPQSR